MTQEECTEAYATLTPVMLVVPARSYGPLLAIETGIAAAVLLISVIGTSAITKRWGPR